MLCFRLYRTGPRSGVCEDVIFNGHGHGFLNPIPRVAVSSSPPPLALSQLIFVAAPCCCLRTSSRLPGRPPLLSGRPPTLCPALPGVGSSGPARALLAVDCGGFAAAQVGGSGALSPRGARDPWPSRRSPGSVTWRTEKVSSPCRAVPAGEDLRQQRAAWPRPPCRPGAAPRQPTVPRPRAPPGTRAPTRQHSRLWRSSGRPRDLLRGQHWPSEAPASPCRLCAAVSPLLRAHGDPARPLAQAGSARG